MNARTRHPEFRDRLEWAFRHTGITTPRDQAEHIQAVCRVSRRTAIRYLQGETRPDSGRAEPLAAGLGVFVGWLLFGGGAPRTAEELRVLQHVRRMEPTDITRLRRFMFRYANGSGQAHRLARLFDEGRIDAGTLLRLAGS